VGKTYQFKSLAGISGWLKIFLVLSFLAHLALLVLSLLAIDSVYRQIEKFTGDFLAYRVFFWFQLATALNGLILIGCAISYFTWLYRANSNVHAAGAQAVRSPAWAIGGYFVPVANIGLGMESVREIWKASKSPENWETLTTTRLVSVWWACWLFGNAALTFVGFNHPETLAALSAQAITRAISYALILGAIAAMVAIVSDVSKFQMRISPAS
jgi:hypothetical protein